MPTRPGYNTPYWVDSNDIETPIDTSAGVKITGNTTFYLVYTKPSDADYVAVNYKGYDGSVDVKSVLAGQPADSNMLTTPSGLPENKKFLYWVLDSDSSKQPKDIVVAKDGSYTFVPVDEPKVLVRFAPDGSTINDDMKTYVDLGSSGSALNPTPDVPSGKKLEKWVIDGTDTDMGSVTIDLSVAKESADYADTYEVVFVAKFIDESEEPEEPEPPTPGGGFTITSLTKPDNNTAQFTMSYTNDTTATIDTIEFRVKLPSGFSTINGYSISGGGTFTATNGASINGNYIECSRSGDYVTLKQVDHNDWGGAGIDIEPGQTITITVNMKNYWPGFTDADVAGAISAEITNTQFK